MIVAYRNQLALVDLAGGEHEVLQATGVDFAVERFNDGACDRKGRLWTGTMDRKMREPVGSLYRVDPDFSVHRIESGITVSNGIAFSPDDRVMYHTDSGASTIYAYDFDLAHGTVRNRRVFADFRGQRGRPDGCTIDAQGHVWVAEVMGSRVVELDPSGRRIREIELPVTRPTCPMFGGDDLRTLYVTSMQHALSKEDLERQPQAGCLFSIRLDVPGLPEPRFAG
jgi:sugar lactone lactonase YvrE